MTDETRIWVKICANTSLEDAQLAAASGADAVGFVFAPSPRRVTIEQAAAIVPHLPACLEKIGVFVDPSLDEIGSTIRACGLTGVQFHSAVAPELTAQLRARVGARVRILRVVHFAADAVEQARHIATDPNVDAILVDSRSATAVGGTGITFNWTEASTTLFQNTETRRRLIAAGGLTPDNVREAIALLRPWGVDVVSGVEAAPGRKHPEKVRRFVSNVRDSGAR